MRINLLYLFVIIVVVLTLYLCGAAVMALVKYIPWG